MLVQQESFEMQEFNFYRCKTGLTGKMKLVSGGSSFVKLSIQVSRFAIGWAENFVFSRIKKRRNKWKKNTKSLNTRHNKMTILLH